LQDEIDLMRMFIRRVIEKTDPDSPLSEDLEVLRTLSFASICLTRLVRTHLIALPETNAMDELNEALRKMVEDMKADPKSLLPYDPQHPVY
jgi:PHP family Zn ribbon phosphoesterase